MQLCRCLPTFRRNILLQSSFTLNMEAIYFSEMLVTTYKTTLRHNIDHNPRFHCRENLKPRRVTSFFLCCLFMHSVLFKCGKSIRFYREYIPDKIFIPPCTKCYANFLRAACTKFRHFITYLTSARCSIQNATPTTTRFSDEMFDKFQRKSVSRVSQAALSSTR
jgi:hypothetical protein